MIFKEYFDGFMFEDVKLGFDKLLELINIRDRQNLLDKVMLGLLHPLYKEFKFSWGREKYLEDNTLVLFEKRYIFMARTEMLPINYKPWFREQVYTCQLCNTLQDEDITHFVLTCRALKGCRPPIFENKSMVGILNDQAMYKELVTYIVTALNTRNVIINNFNF